MTGDSVPGIAWGEWVPGIMVTHGTSVEPTNKGRAVTKRQMPN